MTRRTVAISILSVANIAVTVNADQDAEIDAHIEAESVMVQEFDAYRVAREEVLHAIGAIADETRKNTVMAIFVRNESAWDQLIQSEARIRQGASSADDPVDIRYRRIVEADRAGQRILQYKELAKFIQNQK